MTEEFTIITEWDGEQWTARDEKEGVEVTADQRHTALLELAAAIHASRMRRFQA